MNSVPHYGAVNYKLGHHAMRCKGTSFMIYLRIRQKVSKSRRHGIYAATVRRNFYNFSITEKRVLRRKLKGETMKNAFFWDAAPCRYCVNRHFGGSHRLYLQGIRNPPARNQREQVATIFMTMT
jgi:hypothetical protein